MPGVEAASARQRSAEPVALPASVQSATPPNIGPAVPVGPWLDGLVRNGRTGPFAVLAPAQLINRTPLLARSPIDAGCAPFGKYFDDPEYRSYRSVDSLVACLPGASAVGQEGVVLFGDKVLHDTLRHVAANESAPAIRSMSDDGIVLQDRLTTRRLAGTYMVGHSGMWRSYAQWLHEALPRLVAFTQARAQLPDLKLLLPPLPPGSFQTKTLSLLGIDPAWVEAEAPNEIDRDAEK